MGVTPGARALGRRRAWAASEIGQAVLSGRPFPERPFGGKAPPDLSWQTRANPCLTADETTSYVLVEAQYQSDLGKGDLRPLCGQCPVAYECLTSGIKMHGSGVWGGLVLADGRPAPKTRPRTFAS